MRSLFNRLAQHFGQVMARQDDASLGNRLHGGGIVGRQDSCSRLRRAAGQRAQAIDILPGQLDALVSQPVLEVPVFA